MESKYIMKKLLITGGIEKKNPQEEWSGFKSGIALELDLASLECKPVLEYYTPEEFRPPEPDCSILFKSGEVHGDKVVMTTQTEVLIYQLPDYQLIKRVSLSCFNDIHHARLTDDNSLLVCVTGLDSVFEISLEGNVINEWSSIDEDIWQRFELGKDYRQILTTKPHSAHPNFCFEYKGEKFVTRFMQKDAISLTSNKQFKIDVGGPHDGYVLGENVYFTTVNGFIVGFNLNSCKRIFIKDLNEMNENKMRNLGWCRSLLMVNEHEAIVGFSRMRTSKFSDYLSWVKEKSGVGTTNDFPTRLIKYNFKQDEIEWTINLEKYDLNAVFSVLALSE